MRKKLLSAFLPLALIPLAGAGFLSYNLTKRSLTEKIFAHLESIASLQKSRIVEFSDNSTERFKSFSERLVLRIIVDGYLPFPSQKDQRRLESLLSRIKEGSPDVKALTVLSIEGKAIASTDPSVIGRDFSKDDFILKAKKRTVFDVVNLNGGSRFGAYFAGPINQGGNKYGVLLIEENLDRLFPWIKDYSGFGTTGETFLVKKVTNGDVLYLTSLRFDPNASLKKKASERDNILFNKALLQERIPITSELDYRGEPIIATTRFIKKLNWGLVAKMDQSEAFSSIIELRTWFLVLFLASILGVAFLADVLAKSIVDPLQQLTSMATDIQYGRQWSPSVTFFRNEVGILANAFVSMAKKLLEANEDMELKVHQRTGELSNSEERARSIIETATDAFIETDPDGRVVDWNRQAENTFGWEKSEVLGKMPRDVIVPSRYKGAYNQIFEQYISGQIEAPPDNRTEMLALHKDGHEFPVELTVWKTGSTAAPTLSAFVHDISDRKKAEETLIKKQQDLARANAEREQLELFASLAAHDLQEPLKKIVAFGDLLKTECSDVISGEGQDYLSRMRNAAKRMSELISDLLKFSKITTIKEASSILETKAVVKEVLMDLELRINESGAHIDVGPLPRLYTSYVQLREVFQNVISNAIKFRKKDKTPEISIRSKNLPKGGVEISIQDNGIGLDEKFSERIFRPFERLHRRNEFEGSGVGLAICQRIIINMGGRIRVKSRVGEGAEFLISLPESVCIKEEESLQARTLS